MSPLTMRLDMVRRLLIEHDNSYLENICEPISDMNRLADSLYEDSTTEQTQHWFAVYAIGK